MREVTSVVLAACLFATSIVGNGCAGREPNPVAVSLPDDKTFSCEALLMQKQQALDEMKVLEPKCNKFVTNTLWFVVLPFLMDVKDAEKIEYNALKRRADYLTTLMVDKGCVDMGPEVPPATKK